MNSLALFLRSCVLYGFARLAMIQFGRIRIILDKFTSYEYHAYKGKIYLNIWKNIQTGWKELYDISQ